ncbi:MAG TPA: PAS domain-containing protein [Candidatus Acidoferrales bacterium]|nr:PAS domain-containing protein [Candidatus Acidoferrales bacterium]
MAARPTIDDRARETLDAIDVPVSVARAIRDRRDRILDFRLVFVNQAGGRWAGIDREALVGRLATEVIPALRIDGLYEALERVVLTGERFRENGYHEGTVAGGLAFSATFDLMAVRLGDGYLSAWAETPAPAGRPALEAVIATAQAVLPPG